MTCRFAKMKFVSVFVIGFAILACGFAKRKSKILDFLDSVNWTRALFNLRGPLPEILHGGLPWSFVSIL